MIVKWLDTYTKWGYIHISRKCKNFDIFPTCIKKVHLEMDADVIETSFLPSQPAFRSRGLISWLKAHPKLKEGVNVRITPIKPMEKYRLEILKE